MTSMNRVIPFEEVKKYLGGLVLAEERLDYKAGQNIFYGGHRPYGIYVLRKGRVRLFQKLENGEEKLIRIIEQGQVFGDQAFRENKPYEFGAKAETDISVSFFSRAIFDL